MHVAGETKRAGAQITGIGNAGLGLIEQGVQRHCERVVHMATACEKKIGRNGMKPER